MPGTMTTSLGGITHQSPEEWLSDSIGEIYAAKELHLVGPNPTLKP